MRYVLFCNIIISPLAMIELLKAIKYCCGTSSPAEHRNEKYKMLNLK